MKLVVDANILFASLIKSGETAKLLFSEHHEFFSPEFLFNEFNKYKEVILTKTKRSSEDFQQFLDILKSRIKIIPYERIYPYMREATELSPDPKDTVYIALALLLNCHIWSNDKELSEKQKRIRIIMTAELVEIERE